MPRQKANLDGILAQKEIAFILNTLSSEGFSGFVVGGAVRDALLGLPPGDVDILTNASPQAVASVFVGENTRYVGKAFSITLVNGIEVASCRSAGKDSHSTDSNFPVFDLGMRDFTINSMAWDPFAKVLVDPFEGRRDLEKRIIRFTRDSKDRINEDPLRIIRACRFAARYDSQIEPGSFDAIKTHNHLIGTHGAGERIRMEILKAMTMEKPSRFFNLLHDTGLLAFIFPSLDRCHGFDGGPFHGETVFEHCLLVGDALPPSRPLLRLAGFLHDTGKYDAAKIKDGRPTFPGHEKRTEAMMNDLARLRFSNNEARYILALTKAHMRPLNEESTPRAVRRLMAMLDDLDLSYKDFLRMRIADKKGNLAKSPYSMSDIRIRLLKIQDTISNQTAFNINDLDITGKDIQDILNLAPSPRIGEVKKYLFDKVLEDPKLNTKDKLEKLIRELKP